PFFRRQRLGLFGVRMYGEQRSIAESSSNCHGGRDGLGREERGSRPSVDGCSGIERADRVESEITAVATKVERKPDVEVWRKADRDIGSQAVDQLCDVDAVPRVERHERLDWPSTVELGQQRGDIEVV